MRKIIPMLLIMVVLLLAACGETTPPATIADTTIPPTVVPSVTASIPTPEVAPTVEATIAPIGHITIPSAGTSDRATAHDNENSLFFDTKKVKTGDEFYKNRFERPFTSVNMDYLPDLDIVNFSINSDENFFYIKISMVGLDAGTQTLTGSYGIEIDHNADGRAEILLTTQPPYTAEFSADHTAAYLDINGDVGGNVINRPDDFGGDGFESVIFDLSRGIYPEADPDLVWVRQTTDSDLPAIEIALEKWVFNDQISFMWSVLSSDVVINPTTFYYHDHITPEQAGAANTDDPNYPLKGLAAIDNTCRVPLGFQAVGDEPLGCFVKDGEVEQKATPSADGPNSTCAHLTELCARTQSTRQLFTAQ